MKRLLCPAMDVSDRVRAGNEGLSKASPFWGFL